MKIKIRDYFTYEGKGILFLMLPLLSKWLLPPGIETKLYVNPLDLFNIYVPNILLLFVPIYFRVNKFNSSWLKPLFCFWMLLELIVLCFSDTPNIFMNVFSNTFIFAALYLGLFHKFSQFQIELIKPFCIIGLLIIAIQIIVFAMGLVNYDMGDLGSEFAGIYRVYTTAGESNGSGDIVGLLMLFLLMILKDPRVKIAIVFISTVAVFFTISRSPIIMIVLSFMFFWLKYFRKKIKYNLLVSIIIVGLVLLDVFDPIIERNRNKSIDGDITSGRDVLIEKVIENVRNENGQLFGLGIGNVYQTTEVIYSKEKMPYPGAPHNSYVLLYAEQGLVGLLIFIVIIVAFLKRRYNSNKDGCTLFIILLLSIYNTETVISVNSDYVYISAIFMLLINADKEYEILKPTNKRIK